MSSLFETISYDAGTGKFTWRNHPYFATLTGKPAGSIDAKGFVCIDVNSTRYKASHLAWYFTHGYFPDRIRHVNGITDDDRIVNLKSISSVDNARTTTMAKNNTSGFTGVNLEPNNKWRAKIGYKGKQVSLGTFSVFQDAVLARLEGETKYNYPTR